MSPTGMEASISSKLSRCVACGGKVKLHVEDRALLSVAACPLCALAIFAPDDCDVFPPFVPPRIDRESAWNILATERRFPPGEGPARVKDGRLLLVPFWIEKREESGGAAPATFRSAADLSPVGIPPVSPEGVMPRGLDLPARAQSGDRMGRLQESVTALAALPVRVSLGPSGGTPGEALLALNREPRAAAWSLVYYPVWAFHYALHEKEHHHAVDAVAGRVIGPAREVQWSVVALAASAAVVAVYFVASTVPGVLAGAAALLLALPAWASGLAVMRISMNRYRR